MDVFRLRETVIATYAEYIQSFLRIKDTRIAGQVQDNLVAGRYWPDPLVGINPSSEPGEAVDAPVQRGVLFEGCQRIFRRNKDKNAFGFYLDMEKRYWSKNGGHHFQRVLPMGSTEAEIS